MEIILEIHSKLNSDVQIIDILTEYDTFNIQMLKLIKSLDLKYFELLLKFINNRISKNVSKNDIKQNLIKKSKFNNEQLIDMILNSGPKKIIKPEPEPKPKPKPKPKPVQKNYAIKLDENELYLPKKSLILNQSQNQVLDYYKTNGVKSGIICHATGTGKTNCIYLTMGFNNPNCIFILCTYKTILKQLLYSVRNDKYILNYEKFRQLKEMNYLNMWDYEIYNLADDQIDRKKLIKQLPDINKTSTKKIFLINPQFIMNSARYTHLPKPDVIIHDECHSITGSYTTDFLSYFINQNTAIVGLSATPVRHINKNANYDLIKQIYTSNIISNYENIKAIINKDILNLEFYWFDAILDKSATENKKNPININNMISVINKIYNRLPNKKILIWCGTIAHANYVYEIFNNEAIIKQKFNNILIDHSKVDDPETDSYIKFKNSKGKSILIVAEKYREGSDIEYLDCATFFDIAKTKTPIPFIQSVGRVQRIGYNKEVGFIIDHYEKSKEMSKCEFIINKLIKYYYEFYYHLNKLNNNNDSENNIKNALISYDEIYHNISFETITDEENGIDNIIKIKITDDMFIIIHLNINKEEFDDVEFNFDNTIKICVAKEHNLEANEIIKFEYELFKTCNQEYSIKTNTEYFNRIKEFNYEPNPLEKYKNIWTNWYDYLGIDTSKYPKTSDEWKKRCRQLKIKNYFDYQNIILNQNIIDMPLMPEEIYPIKNLITEFAPDVLIL